MDDLSVKLLNDKESQNEPLTDLDCNIFIIGDKSKKKYIYYLFFF